MQKIQHAADQIAAAYDSGPLDALDPSSRPDNLQEAYAVQDRVTHAKAWHRVGWKAGLTSAATRATWSVDTPVVAGQLLAHAVHASPHVSSDSAQMIVEAEYTVRLLKDLPLRERPYAAAEMAGFIDAICPSIEVVRSRFAPGSTPGLYASVADNSSHGWLVLGDPLVAWDHFDLLDQTAILFVNGKLVAEGCGADILGSPLEVVAWFANHCASRGVPLKAGELIATGACAKTTTQGPADITASFGPLGSARLHLT